MSKVRTYTMGWGLPTDVDVATVRVRATASPEVPTYDTPFDDVGLVAQCSLPLPHTPMIDGELSIAVSTVDDVGNESDLSVITFPFDLVAPQPVTGLHVS